VEIMALETVKWKEKCRDLEAQNIKLQQEIEELKILNNHYLEQIRLSKAKRFGSSSEQNMTDGQLLLENFDEAETHANPAIPEPAFEEITYKRKKKKGQREEFYKNLPTEQKIYELPESEQVCPDCGGAMHACGHSVLRRTVEIIPAKIKAVEHVQTAYSCRNCEKNAAETPMKKAEVPAPVIPGSGVASPSLLSYILSNKYALALPLYRQEQEFKRLGLNISRTTMANWVIKSAAILLIIYNLLKSELVRNDVLHADESTVQVLREDGRKATSKSYEWMYHTGKNTEKPVALFEYKPTREGQNAAEFLRDFSGFLHCDGYAGYKKLEKQGVILVECWVHARRYFTDCLKALPKEKQPKASAYIGVQYCDALFTLERKYDKENLSHEERKSRREQDSKPIADRFFEWCEKQNALPKSLFGKAITYALNQKQWLMNFLGDGRLELSNNRAERTVRPFTIGRKNWLFSTSTDGATASSIIYSIVETAYANGLVPYLYLNFLLENVQSTTDERHHELLPWSPTVNRLCSAPTSKS
jgi:transposase